MKILKLIDKISLNDWLGDYFSMHDKSICNKILAFEKEYENYSIFIKIKIDGYFLKNNIGFSFNYLKLLEIEYFEIETKKNISDIEFNLIEELLNKKIKELIEFIY